MNIYISPHPDDAVLSCGGRILKNKKQSVINVFSKKYSGITDWDRKCGLVKRPMKQRIKEDKQILSSLNIKSVYLKFYDDAVYKEIKRRKRPKKEAEVIRKNLEKILNKFSEGSKFFFPAGLGHEDHKLLADIGRKMTERFNIIFYEDIPYALRSNFNFNDNYKITSVMDKKMDLILSYKTQIRGFFDLTNSTDLSEFSKKIKKHHLGKVDDFYEKTISFEGLKKISYS